MGGRGRGRGKTSMSINVEQLGFGKGETLPGPVLQPPPKYPPLDYKPIPFNITNEVNYLLEIKRDFAEFMRDSPINVQPIIINKDIERYSDRFQDLITDKTGYEERYDWTRIPLELKPISRKRKGQTNKGTGKKRKDVDVESKLQELEKKESYQQSETEEDGKDEGEDDEKDPEDPVDEEEEELDEEMDDGTDYVNNYFDNGEGFDEEDDNLDDGPVY